MRLIVIFVVKLKEEVKPPSNIKRDGRWVTNPKYAAWYRRTHPEQVNSYQRSYFERFPKKYEEHKRKMKEYCRRRYAQGLSWKQTHREQSLSYLKTYMKGYRERNKEKIRAYKKAYHLRKKEEKLKSGDKL